MLAATVRGQDWSLRMTEPGQVCEGCGRRVPVPKEDSAPRKRKQFNISVPADKEDGDEVLRTLIEAARVKLVTSGAFVYGDKCPPYYILTVALSDWLTS